MPEIPTFWGGIPPWPRVLLPIWLPGSPPHPVGFDRGHILSPTLIGPRGAPMEPGGPAVPSLYIPFGPGPYCPQDEDLPRESQHVEILVEPPGREFPSVQTPLPGCYSSVLSLLTPSVCVVLPLHAKRATGPPGSRLPHYGVRFIIGRCAAGWYIIQDYEL